jgi:gliding motility-associated lipoprotein GldH
MKSTGLIILLVGILAYSCDKLRVSEEFIRIPSKGWERSNILHFNVNIMDTLNPHNVLIHVRNTGKYEYSNLYLFVTVCAPNGSEIRDTIEITLADEHGKWLGKGPATVYTLTYPYKTNIRFPVRGIYGFDIEQAMWNKTLQYITDVGLRVEEARPSR